MDDRDRKYAKAATYIVALILLYFGGAAWVWGAAGLFGAFLSAVALVFLGIVWGLIFEILRF